MVDPEFTLTLELVTEASNLAGLMSSLVITHPEVQASSPQIILAALFIFASGQARSMGASPQLQAFLFGHALHGIRTAPTVEH